MGRKKTDSPTLFPWDKIFSEDENEFNEAIEYCKSENNGSENLKRAVTTIGSGYNSGSKTVLCERIKQKAIQIRYQIDKEKNANKRDKLRKDVIDYYTKTFLKKFEGKEEGIKNIAIPARPNLPILTEEEKRVFVSPPSSPRSSPPSSPRNSPPSSPRRVSPIIEEEEEFELLPKNVPYVDDNSLLQARTIIYYKNAPIVNGKKSLSPKIFYEQLQSLYYGVVPDNSVLLSKESIKNAILQLPNIIKNSGGKLKQETIDNAQAVINKSETMKEYQRQIVIEEEVIREELPERPLEEVYKSTVSENDIINYIKTKGWEEPKYKSKEALCDYVLKQIKGEDVRSEIEYKSIESRIDKLSDNLISLLDMHEQRINELEKAKKNIGSGSKKKVKFGSNQIKIIEEETEEIEKQIHDVKEQLQEAKENKEQLEEQQEEQKQLCFKMKQWLDQDDFDRVEVEKDLICNNEGDVCNINSGLCEPSVEGDYTSSLGIAKIKGSKDVVDKMYNKYTNKPAVIEIEEEEIIPVSKVQKIPTETLREQIKLILSTSDLDEVSKKDILEQLNMFFNVNLNKRKKEIYSLIEDEFNEILESRKVAQPVVPVIEIEEEEIKPVSKVKKQKIPTETLREQVKLILSSSSDLDSLTADDITYELSMFFKVKLFKRKDEISRLLEEEKEKIISSRKEEEISMGEELPEEEISMGEELPEEEIPEVTEKQIVEKTVEFLEMAGKSINEKEIRNKVQQHFNIDIEPYKAIIKTTIKNFIRELKDKRKKCNTIPLEQDVDDITRAKDLMCDEGDACNLSKSRCDPIEESSYPVEELTIGGMLVKVTGKNKIVEALKQKIIKSGGAIPMVESEEIVEKEVSKEVSKEEEKPLEEVIKESEAQDVFESKLPGTRINLEDLIRNIKSISKTDIITSAQNKIKSAERKCIERIAKCAGIKI